MPILGRVGIGLTVLQMLLQILATAAGREVTGYSAMGLTVETTLYMRRFARIRFLVLRNSVGRFGGLLVGSLINFSRQAPSIFNWSSL